MPNEYEAIHLQPLPCRFQVFDRGLNGIWGLGSNNGVGIGGAIVQVNASEFALKALRKGPGMQEADTVDDAGPPPSFHDIPWGCRAQDDPAGSRGERGRWAWGRGRAGAGGAE